MRLHFVTVPVHGSADAETELNQFLASRRVVAVDRQLVPDGTRSAWAICVEYVDAPAAAPNAPNPNSKGIDYRDVLPTAQFQVFAKLRDLRNKIAKHDGVPAYAIFTNEQIAEMARRSVRSKAELAGIDGIGPAKVEKYSVRFLEILCAEGPVIPPPAASACDDAAP